jgi:uncharacterized protein YciI
MKRLFAVVRTRGDAWRADRPMEDHPEWQAHADFMDALVSDGFVLLGGPLEGTPDVLLVVEASTEEEIRTRLDGDPWAESGLLLLRAITPWQLRLGGFDRAR